VAKKKKFKIVWKDTTYWCTAKGDYEIVNLEDGFLWETILWCIRNALSLHHQAAAIRRSKKNKTGDATLAAYYWLSIQPLFRAMIQESIRRKLTFPEDIVMYIKGYLLDNSGLLDGYKPWADPQFAHQADELQDFLNEPLIPPEIEHGKERRVIDL